MNKRTFALTMTLLNAGAVLMAGILPMIVSTSLSTPIITFIDAIVNGLIIYFGTEDSQAQASKNSS